MRSTVAPSRSTICQGTSADPLPRAYLHYTLELVLVEWVYDQLTRSFFVTDEVIRRKRNVYWKMQIENSSPEIIYLSSLVLDGSPDSNSATILVNTFLMVKEGLPTLVTSNVSYQVLRRRATYVVNDVWNFEELGLFYMMAPSQTNGPGRIEGQKAEAASNISHTRQR